jgi:hypothetical protein
MPFTVLKISSSKEDQVDVLGEFESCEAAREFADARRNEDETNEYDYLVESPEPKSAQHRRELQDLHSWLVRPRRSNPRSYSWR